MLFRKKTRGITQLSTKPIGQAVDALEEFSDMTGTINYRGFREIGLPTLGKRWIDKALHQVDEIHFNLDGFPYKGIAIADSTEKERWLGFRMGNHTN